MAFGLSNYHNWKHVMQRSETTIITILLLLTIFSHGTSANEMVRLRKHIFEDGQIDPHSRPVQNHTDTVTVELLFDLSHIHTLDELTGTLTVNGFIRLIWEDQSLRWDPEEYNDLGYLIIPHSALWKPDITLYNSAAAVDMDHYGDSTMYITNDGMVHWFPPVTFHATCPIDHKLYPFDEHQCSIVLGSWTYDNAAVNIQLSQEHNDSQVSLLEHYSENPQWQLLSVDSSTRDIIHECCEDGYKVVEYRLHLRRRSPLHKFVLVVPSIVTVALTLALFWLPPNAGEKIILGGIVAIVQVAMLLFLGSSIAPGGKSVPAIVLFCGNSLMMTALSLIISVIVINLSRSHDYSPSPAWILRLTNARSVRQIFCLGALPYQVSCSKLLDDNHVELGDQSERAVNGIDSMDNHLSNRFQTICTKSHGGSSPMHVEWIRLATVIDRLCFIIYIVIFMVVLTVSRKGRVWLCCRGLSHCWQCQ